MSTTPTQHENGAGVSEAVFPVASYREAAVHLRRPFTAEAVKFKVQATWPKEKPANALIVVYIDARLVDERLNAVCPHLWVDTYEPLAGGLLLCRLTVDGLTRNDVGEGYQGKGLYSDALKRAAVKFGVGVSLYAVPKIMLAKRDGLRDVRTQKGPSLALTDQGEVRCRAIYTDWLNDAGEAKFGQALDHGDVAGSVGDPEEMQEEEGPRQAPQQPDPIPEPISEAQARELYDAAVAVVDATMLQRAVAHLAGRDPGELADRDEAIARMTVLDAPAADRLAAWIKDKAAKREEADDAA